MYFNFFVFRHFSTTYLTTMTPPKNWGHVIFLMQNFMRNSQVSFFLLLGEVVRSYIHPNTCLIRHFCRAYGRKPLQGMLFYCLRDLIMNIAPESPYHSSHRSVLRDTTEGLNKYNDNPAQGTEEVHDTSSGACISARKESIPTDHNNNSTRDGVLYDTHTEPIPSHNSN